MIRIMADSHGQPETIAAALGVFTDMDCQPIYHLGDVCDSIHPEAAEVCLGPSRDPRVIIIKSNMVWKSEENVIECLSFR
jgi:predicted phosphodiesterase